MMTVDVMFALVTVSGSLMVVAMAQVAQVRRRQRDEYAKSVQELWQESTLMRQELREQLRIVMDDIAEQRTPKPTRKPTIFPAHWNGPRGPGM